MADYKSFGLFSKYQVERTDGREVDPGERLFVLRYDKHDEWGRAARVTLREFADRIHRLGYTALADDLRAELDQLDREAQLRLASR